MVKIRFFRREYPANRIRVYTDKTRLRGLKNEWLKLGYFLESAEADIVCVDANSIRRLSFVCVDANSIRRLSFVCVDANSIRRLRFVCVDANSIRRLHFVCIDANSIRRLSFVYVDANSIRRLNLSLSRKQLLSNQPFINI